MFNIHTNIHTMTSEIIKDDKNVQNIMLVALYHSLFYSPTLLAIQMFVVGLMMPVAVIRLVT